MPYLLNSRLIYVKIYTIISTKEIHATMNILIAKFENKFKTNFNDISFQYMNTKITFSSTDDNYSLVLQGRKSEKTLKNLFFNFYSVMFLFLGFFPKLEAVTFNNTPSNLSNLSKRYETFGFFLHESNILCDFSSKTINNLTLTNFETLRKTPFHALECITSVTYSKITLEHKILLLLQVIDGLIPLSKTQIKTYKTKFDTMCNKGVQGNSQGDYAALVYYLCEKYFFYYNKKLSCNMLKTLKTSKKNFVLTISDTRNWYSHYLDDNKKRKRLQNDPILLFAYTDIILFSLRIMLASSLGVSVPEENIKKFYLQLKNWIILRNAKKDTFLKPF